MNIEEKAEYIDRVMGFYFDGPFMDTAKQFPSPESQVETWYKFARVFQRVANTCSIPKAEWEILQLFIEDATTEYESSLFFDESPDTEAELGVGYDGYEIPEGFAKRYQKTIWLEVLREYDS